MGFSSMRRHHGSAGMTTRASCSRSTSNAPTRNDAAPTRNNAAPTRNDAAPTRNNAAPTKERRRAERLAAKLRELGVDPNNV